MTPHPVTPPLRQLGLFDAVCIMVGVVIGAGIYESPSRVASNVPDATALLLVWTFGGLLAFVGALCYAELITAYPSAGGEYVYLTRAFGAWVGFLYGWAELLVIRTGSIGAVAFVFSDYMIRIAPLPPRSQVGTPIWALVAQGVVTLVLIVTFGSRDGFETLVKYTAAAVWFFFLLTGLLLFVLRWRDRERARPYRTLGYPLTPLVFCASCAYMLYGSLSYAPLESIWGGAVVLSGLPLYWLSSRRSKGKE
jgi:amino acid transporter